MKSSTVVTMGIINVGQAGSVPETFTGTFSECILGLAQWLGPVSMATRFDLVIARTPEEALNALRIRGRQTNGAATDSDDLAKSIQAMMAEGVD